MSTVYCSCTMDVLRELYMEILLTVKWALFCLLPTAHAQVVKRVVGLYDDASIKPFKAAEGVEADYVLRCCFADCQVLYKPVRWRNSHQEAGLHVFFHRFQLNRSTAQRTAAGEFNNLCATVFTSTRSLFISNQTKLWVANMKPINADSSPLIVFLFHFFDWFIFMNRRGMKINRINLSSCVTSYIVVIESGCHIRNTGRNATVKHKLHNGEGN